MNIHRTLFSSGRGLDIRLTLFFGLAALIIGIWSVPASLWEWDEILFARGLHVYDVPTHSPHPPGFPLYIFAARGALLLTPDDKTALCLVGLVFAFILGAAAFAAFRELFEDRRPAAAGAALLLAVPPVLVYLGAPRSDVPGMAVGLLILALALKGRTSPRALVLAGLALGLGFGVRVTSFFAAAPVLVFVSLIYLKRRRWKPVFISAGLAVFGVLLCYVPVVLHTGLARYREALRNHTHYTSSTDTFLAPGINGNMGYRLSRYFLESWGNPFFAWTVYLLAATGLVFLLLRRRGRTIGWLSLSFLPIMIFSVLYMTPLAAALYALPFLPLFAGLAGAALAPPGRPDAPSGPWARGRILGGVLTAAAVGVSLIWTAPILEMRRNQDSPSWQSVRRILEKRDPRRTDLYYDGYFLPFVGYVFGSYRCIPFESETPRVFNLLDPEASVKAAFALTGSPLAKGAVDHFQWDRARGVERLKGLSLGRYFDVYIGDLDFQRKIVYGEGWSIDEDGGGKTWRWMGRKSDTALLALHDQMILRIKAVVPAEALKPGEKAAVMVKLDGRAVDRFTAGGGLFERTITVATLPPSAWKRLTIETDRTIVPAALKLSGDDRELGLQIYELTWNPAPGSEKSLYGLEDFAAGGWYPVERAWRWTGAEAFIKLPAIWTAGRLDLQMEVPEGKNGTRARVTLEIEGRVIDSFAPPAGPFTRSYSVPREIHGGKESRLRITTDRVVPAPLARNLGVQVYYASWAPVAINP
jgi:4-amino-4-deoxy-L-arabinose transferase-like glycosyltransferase